MKLLILHSAVLFCLCSLAQTNSSTISYSDFSQAAINELKEMKQQPSQPFRFGVPIKKNIIFNESAQKEIVASDTIQVLSIYYENAVNIGLIFSHFDLIENEKLVVKGKDESFTFTSQNSTFDQRLGTSSIEGDSISIFFFSDRATNLIVEQVIFGFREARLPQIKNNSKLNTSGNCHYDINCPEGATWADQKTGVVRISLSGSICSGSMINNQLNDGSPYLLTANHCFAASSDVSTWVFRFDYESSVPVCAGSADSNEPPTPFKQINGARLKANNNNSDFCLLELNALPSSTTFYNGWERTLLPNNNVTCIHHPDGDVMKISGSTAVIKTDVYDGITTLKVPTWDYGSTEGGSSGAPLFSDDKLIVGQLYGGLGACSGNSPNSQADYFGEFNTSWDNSKGKFYRLKDWLDPIAINPSKIQGIYHVPKNLDVKITGLSNIDRMVCNTDNIIPNINVMNLGLTTVTTVEVSIVTSIDSVYISRSVNINSGQVGIVVGSTIQIASPFDQLKVTIEKVNGVIDEELGNNRVSTSLVSYQDVKEGEVRFKTDCFGSESSWFLYNSDNILIVGNGPYSDESSAVWENTSICLPIDCYRLQIYDSYGDGLTGGDGNGCNENGEVRVVLDGKTLVSLSDPDFGSQKILNFCVTEDGGVEVSNQFFSYPNPFSESISIKNDFSETKETQILLYDITGVLIFDYKHDFNAQEIFSIYTDNLAAGVYLLHIKTADGLVKDKLTKY